MEKLEKSIQEKRAQCLRQIQEYISINYNRTPHIHQNNRPLLSPEQEEKLAIASLLQISDCFTQLTQFCLSHYHNFPIAQELRKKLSENREKVKELKKKSVQQQLVKIEEVANEQREKKKQEPANQQITGYTLFLKEKSQQISEVELQCNTHKALFISNLWNNMSWQQREPYEKTAQKLKNKKNQNTNTNQSKSNQEGLLNGHSKLEKPTQSQPSKKETNGISNFLKRKANKAKAKKAEEKGKESSSSSLQSDILSDSLQGRQNGRQKQLIKKHLENPISKKVSKNKPKILKVMYGQQRRG